MLPPLPEQKDSVTRFVIHEFFSVLDFAHQLKTENKQQVNL
jgi:hypothetical protein